MYDTFGKPGPGGSMLERYTTQLGDLVERRHREAALIEAKEEAERQAASARDANRALQHEMEQRLETLAHLEHVANHDALTGLPNRNLFNSRLEQVLASAKRSNMAVALMFLDLDHFKSVNDSLGHAVGDDLLKAVARRLTECVRGQDTVARLGGDEFAIIQVGLNYPADSHVQAQRILEALAEPFQISPHKLYTGASIGITVAPDDAETTEQLQSNADLAMYQAKEANRNTFRFFDADLNEAVQRRLFLEQELRTAVAQGQFYVYYQPKVRLKDLVLAGAEALVRWRHPEKGIVSPAEFIPVAEKTGTISQIGEWMFYESCKQFKEWQLEGEAPMVVAVNLSAVQFRERDVPAMVRDVLRETNLDPSCLELEITETAVMSDMRGAVDVLVELHALGVNLSIDDFGTGYSSLSYLRQLPVNKIKIDRSFTAEIDRFEAASTIAHAVIMLGKSLGLEVVAEGIENEEQLRYLVELECEEGQGALFSMPLPPDEFAAFARTMGRNLPN